MADAGSQDVDRQHHRESCSTNVQRLGRERPAIYSTISTRRRLNKVVAAIHELPPPIVALV
jgi:hypothetical protein